MIDLVCISIAIGLVVSLMFSEYLGKAAGGLVVPGYLALSLTRPVDIALTLAAAVATYAVVHWVSTGLIVYGKRRTAAMVLVGFVIGATLRMLIGQLTSSAADPAHPGYTVIGFIIPGLIAIWCDRQGLVDTLATLATATAVVRLVLVLVVTSQLELHELQQQRREPDAIGSRSGIYAAEPSGTARPDSQGRGAPIEESIE